MLSFPKKGGTDREARYQFLEKERDAQYQRCGRSDKYMVIFHSLLMHNVMARCDV
jgi:hypothetical protein